jgi:serine protease Do
MRRVVAAIVLVFPFAVAAAPAGARAQLPSGEIISLEALQNQLAAVAEQVRPSVVAIRTDRRVRIESRDGRPAGPDDEAPRGRERAQNAVGTGTIISSNGFILTNEHVIQSANPQDIECILSDGRVFQAQGITSDPRSDLAVIRIDATDLQPARLGDLSNVRQGHFAIVMGNPFGTASDNYGRPAMSFGVVSAIGQDLTPKLDALQNRYYGNLIQTDARINPGNSGGPLLNIHSEVIGVTTAISTRSGSSEGVGYAISIDRRTKDIIDQLRQGQPVEYGHLGVQLARPTPDERRRAGAPGRNGAIIREVQPGTPAAQSDLKPNDLVVGFDGQPVEDVDQLIRLVGSARVGVQVDVTVYRNRQELVIPVVPGRRQQLIQGIHIDLPFAWRGMRLSDPTAEVIQSFNLPDEVQGVVVTHVESDSPAEKAGLKPGNVISQIADEPVKGVRRVREVGPALTGPVKVIVADDPAGERTLP